MSLEVHTTFCVQIGEKSRIACERVVIRGWYEHFALWMYLQFWTFIERWQKFVFHKKIIYYVFYLRPSKYTIVHEHYTIFQFSRSKTNHLVFKKNIFHRSRWSGRYEHFARLRRRGAIGCMLLYAQACNATFSARLDTKSILSKNFHLFFLWILLLNNTTHFKSILVISKLLEISQIKNVLIWPITLNEF